MTLDDFYKQKIAALLHDPPSKCWFLDGSRGRRDHESEAKEIAKQLFGSETISKLIDDTSVRKADHLASSLDRWLLEVAMGGKYEPDSYRVKSSKLLNQFSQKRSEFYSMETIIPARFDSLLNNFEKTLSELLQEDIYRDNWREIYHILYASLEYCWAKEVGVIGPADTRVPTHSIFDHLYATATALNMLDEQGRISGYFVTIDLAGIQSFVSAARKMKDLWAGSWLVSALAWSLVEEFVKILGPDILVLPTARGNPFYFHTFRGLTRESTREKSYEDIGKLFFGYEGYPKNPVMPGTVSFVLPKREDILFELSKETGHDFSDKVKIRDSISQIFHQKWKDLSSRLAEDDLEEEYNHLGVFDVPPLRLRVSIEEISDSPPSKEAHDEITCGSEVHAKSAEYLAYHVAFHNAAKELRKQAKLKISPFIDLDLTSRTKDKYHVCHVCGVLPSSKKTEDGEQLCAYCAIRRELTKSEGGGFLSALNSLYSFGGTKKVEDLVIPSVSDVAARPFIRQLCEAQTKEVKEAAEKHLGWIPWFKSCKELDRDWRCLRGLNAEKQLFGEDEENEQSRLEASSLLSELRKEGFNERLNPYYAILKADADNMGKLVSGLLGPSKQEDHREHGGVSSLDFELFSHLSSSTENKTLQRVISLLSVQDYKRASETACNEFRSGRSKDDLVKDFECLHKRLEEGSKFASKGGKRERNWNSNLILSPSYHAMISRTLMKLATDIAVIVSENDGELIYAGGDDVLAILPAKNAIQAAGKIRERFRGDENGQMGFLMLLQKNQASIPSMGDLGVSMSILYTHHKYPLSVSLEQSSANEEKLAKKTKWVASEHAVEKDSLVLAYSPRGGQSTVGVIPLNDKKAMDLLSCLLDNMQSRESQTERSVNLSASFLRDLSESYDKISKAYDQSKDIAKSMLHRILERNCAEPNKKNEGKKKNEIIDQLTEAIFEAFAIRLEITGREPSRLAHEVMTSTLAIRGAIQ